MPAPSDIRHFMHGQLLQTPTLPTVSFAGKTVIVTGANSGLGLEVAKQLWLNVSTLILACRDVCRGETAKKEILGAAEPKTSIEVWQIDMADFSSVKAFAGRVSKELPRLDALLANAGVSTNIYQAAEGFEQTLTVNVLSTFLLSTLCMPMLRRTASETREPTHLTITGSNVHSFADHKQLQKCPKGQIFKTLSDPKDADMAARYFLSKLIVMLCAQEMAYMELWSSKSKAPAVIINCPSPGWCKTPLFRQDDGGFMGRNMLKLIGREGEVGARTLTSAIAAGEETHGHYLSECRVKPASVWVRSSEGQQMQKQLWNELVVLLRDVSPDTTVFAQ